MGDCMASTTEDGADWAELWFDPGPTGTVFGVPFAVVEDSDSFLFDSLIFSSFKNPIVKQNKKKIIKRKKKLRLSMSFGNKTVGCRTESNNGRVGPKAPHIATGRKME